MQSDDSDDKICDINEAVVEELRRRSRAGIQEYGVTVAEAPLKRRDWLQHALEESLDLSVYLRKLIAFEDGEANGDSDEPTEPTEPTFILYGHDAEAPNLIRLWAERLCLKIYRNERPQEDIEIVREAFNCATRMQKWRKDNE